MKEFQEDVYTLDSAPYISFNHIIMYDKEGTHIMTNHGYCWYKDKSHIAGFNERITNKITDDSKRAVEILSKSGKDCDVIIKEALVQNVKSIFPLSILYNRCDYDFRKWVDGISIFSGKDALCICPSLELPYSFVICFKYDIRNNLVFYGEYSGGTYEDN